MCVLNSWNADVYESFSFKIIQYFERLCMYNTVLLPDSSHFTKYLRPSLWVSYIVHLLTELMRFSENSDTLSLAGFVKRWWKTSETCEATSQKHFVQNLQVTESLRYYLHRKRISLTPRFPFHTAVQLCTLCNEPSCFPNEVKVKNIKQLDMG